MNFYYMKTAKIPAFGNIALYGNIALSVCLSVCLKIDYTLGCLEYMCSVSSPLIRHVTFSYIKECSNFIQVKARKY